MLSLRGGKVRIEADGPLRAFFLRRFQLATIEVESPSPISAFGASAGEIVRTE